jgi:hypothetical protein
MFPQPPEKKSSYLLLTDVILVLTVPLAVLLHGFTCLPSAIELPLSAI